MRIGSNPQKDRQFIDPDFFHQVVIPVYIPNQDEYFKDALQILSLCIASLAITSHQKTFITIINNGSCHEVVNYLNDLQASGKIHEVMHTQNIGKVNAIAKGISGHSFPLVTISDADVLFKNGWQQATYEIFEKMSRAGAVATTPNSKNFKHHTFNIFFEFLFSNALRFTIVKDADAMKEFARSVGNETFFNTANLEKYMTITRNGVRAVVGAGHYVCTYRGEIFENAGKIYAKNYIGGNALNHKIDREVVQNDFWRLSTENNFTFHMGNVIEPWMQEIMSGLAKQGELQPPRLDKGNPNQLWRRIKELLVTGILYRLPLWKKFLCYKGLTKSEAKTY